eukprot:m.196096 g.196096  ORF g.196096 m.196096 type:complete len:1198 (-) comp17645_c1_seq2:205-3798(-)
MADSLGLSELLVALPRPAAVAAAASALAPTTQQDVELDALLTSFFPRVAGVRSPASATSGTAATASAAGPASPSGSSSATAAPATTSSPGTTVAAAAAEPRRYCNTSNLDIYLSEQLEYLKTQQSSRAPSSQSGRRLGPPIVMFDPETLHPAPRSQDDSQPFLSFSGHGRFSSVRANTCVATGKWMYEAQMGTAGLQQIGWAMSNCVFSDENGVGDSPDSYAYDGKRLKLWNQGPRSYGDHWVEGDVIGCCLDLDEGKVQFYRNGHDMGVASINVRVGPNKAYFPAISLVLGESCAVNFGGEPFFYPVAGYSPLQAPPVSLPIAEYLVAALARIVDSWRASEETQVTRLTSLRTICAGHVWNRLSALLSQRYNLTGPLLSLFMAQLEHDDARARLDLLINLMAAMLEEEPLQDIINSLMRRLAKSCCASSPWRADCSAASFVRVAVALLRNETILRLWLSTPQCGLQLEGLLKSRLEGPDDAEYAFPHVWWPGCPPEYDRAKFEDALQKNRKACQDLEEVQYEMTSILFNTTKPLFSNVRGGQLRSPRNFFVNFVDELSNRVARSEARQDVLPDISTLGNCIFLTIRLLQQTPQFQEVESLCDEAAFTNNLVVSDGANRFGGMAPVLRKECNDKLPEATRMPGEVVRLFVACIRMFSPAIGSSIKQLLAVNSDFISLTRAFSKVQEEHWRCLASPDETVSHFSATIIESYKKNIGDALRGSVLQEHAYLSDAKVEAMISLLEVLTRTLKSHIIGDFLQFVPTFLSDCAFDIFSALSTRPAARLDQPQEPTHLLRNSKAVPLLLSMTDILTSLMTSPKVIFPGLADGVLLTVRSIMWEPVYLRIVEMDAVICRRLMKANMQSLDGRFWITGVGLLVRCWANIGFAFKACAQLSGLVEEESNAACSSAPMRAALRSVCLDDPAAADTFINKLLNHVNWTISELDQSMSEALTNAENNASAAERQEILRRFTVLFDLGTSLMRLLENVLTDVPEICTEGEQAPTNLKRSVEVSLHLLERAASHKLLVPVTPENQSQLKTTHAVQIMAPICGIFLTLSRLNERLGGAVHKQFLTTSSINEESFTYLIGPEPDFANRPGILPEEVASLQAFVERVTREMREYEEAKENEGAGHGLESMESINEDERCVICCDAKISVVFIPCQHKSCRMCIQRHLLNDTKCFFCNAKVERYDPIDAAETKAA